MGTAIGLREAISPWSIDEFLATSWERDPLVVKRADATYFAPLISTNEFDEIVASTGLRHPYFRVFRAGELVPVEQTTTARQLGPDLDPGLADLNKLYDEYGAGGTLALQAAERWWPSLRDLAADFQSELGFSTQVHVYLTPAGAQGAPVHYDTHDVFVLQVEGRKTWDVWRPIKELPLRLTENAYDTRAVEAEAEREPLLSVGLDAGDALYLPRGFIHRARTEADSSLHVTVSIMVDRWLDVAKLAVSRRLSALRDEVDLRASIPFGRSPLAEPTETESNLFRAAIDRLLNGLRDELFASFDSVAADGAAPQTPSVRGRFVDLVAALTIRDSTILTLRQDRSRGPITESDAMAVAANGHDKGIDSRHRAALTFAFSAGEFRPADWANDLDSEERIALARQLVEFGIFSVSE
jgi:ribosomal protein L16 Arg81 hydroxylase